MDATFIGHVVRYSYTTFRLAGISGLSSGLIGIRGLDLVSSAILFRLRGIAYALLLSPSDEAVDSAEFITG